MAQFRNNHAQEGTSGQQEITVVNIQRFAEDKQKVELPAYATNLQQEKADCTDWVSVQSQFVIFRESHPDWRPCAPPKFYFQQFHNPLWLIVHTIEKKAYNDLHFETLFYLMQYLGEYYSQPGY